MFGYVLPQKSEMKVRDFETYRAYYCGVCKQLQKSYGVFSRFLLNYDLVLLAIVSDSLSGQAGEERFEGCFANPFTKRKTYHATAGLQLASDGLIMLSYHKIYDNIYDSSFLKRAGYRLLSLFMRRMYRIAAKAHPELDAILTHEMQRQQELESAGCQSADEAADPTAKMCEALFRAAAPSEEDRGTAGRMGLFAGQVAYLLDAAEDYTEDQKKGGYNVFLQAGFSFEQAVLETRARCNMAAGEIARCFNQMPVLQNKAILENIIFLGLPAAIAQAGTKRNRRTPKHGQIESV